MLITFYITNYSPDLLDMTEPWYAEIYTK
jgi:hypothetical protein